MLFTVSTPTYNRAHTLGRVFESLKVQTLRDFEWLIVDDGSTDGTRALVEQWINDPHIDFPIRYIWQENKHKKVAHNCAVQEARGELLLVFDSDDRCVPTALERFRAHWQAIPEEIRDEFAGVWCLCKTESGQIVGDRFPQSEWIDSNLLDIFYRYKVRGEKWWAMRTDVLRNFLFREDIPGFVPEGTVWFEIAKHYKTRFVNEPLRIYCQDVPGLIAREGQVIDVSKNVIGTVYAKWRVLSEDIAWFRYAPKWFYLEAARLLRFWLHTDSHSRKLVQFWPTSLLGKLLVVAASPLGLLMWLRDSRRWNRYLRREAS